MKENIKSVVVLTAICLVVAALLAVTNFYTAPIIEEHKANAANESLTIVMPEAKGFEEFVLPEGSPATVKNLYKETSGLGYVAILGTTSQYSSGEMGITVGFTADGKISGISLTSYMESKDFGADYPETYIGQDSALGGVDTVAGVTYSSMAFKNAIADAFTVLVENDLVAEGQKSEEQLIGEVMPLALPGSANALNNCVVDPVEGVSAPVTAAYKAKNGSGYIFVVSGSNGTVVCGVNAFGEAKCFDLEGNDVTDSEADAVAAAKAAFAPLATENLESNLATAQRAVDEGVEVAPVEATGSFSCVTAAFTAEVEGETQYIIITQPLGYGDEPMKMLHVINANGEVVTFKTLSELILHGEYYSEHQLTDEGAYREQFLGLTSDTYSDDMTLVAGATMTSNAVSSSFNAAFEVFNSVKGAAN